MLVSLRLVTGLRRIISPCCSNDAHRMNSAQVCHFSCVDACAWKWIMIPIRVAFTLHPAIWAADYADLLFRVY